MTGPIHGRIRESIEELTKLGERNEIECFNDLFSLINFTCPIPTSIWQIRYVLADAIIRSRSCEQRFPELLPPTGQPGGHLPNSQCAELCRLSSYVAMIFPAVTLRACIPISNP